MNVFAKTRTNKGKICLKLGNGKWNKLTGQHFGVSTVRDSEKMGWNFISSATTVNLYNTICIDGKSLVGIDYNTEQARVGLRLFQNIPWQKTKD